MGPDRIDSVSGQLFFPRELGSPYAILLYSIVPAELRPVLRVINRNSVLAEPEWDQVRPGIEVIRGL